MGMVCQKRGYLGLGITKIQGGASYIQNRLIFELCD